jgi:hypothetical protein
MARTVFALVLCLAVFAQVVTASYLYDAGSGDSSSGSYSYAGSDWMSCAIDGDWDDVQQCDPGTRQNAFVCYNPEDNEILDCDNIPDHVNSWHQESRGHRCEVNGAAVDCFRSSDNNNEPGGTWDPFATLGDAAVPAIAGLCVLRILLAILRLRIRVRMNQKIAGSAYMPKDEADAIFDGRHVEFTLTEVQRLTCARRLLNFVVGVRDIVNVLKKLPPPLGMAFSGIFGLIGGILGTVLSPITMLVSTITQACSNFGSGSEVVSAAKGFAAAKGQEVKSTALSGESFEKVVMIEAKDESGQVLATYIVNDGRHWLQRSQRWEEGAYLTIRRLQGGEKGPVLLHTRQRYRCCCCCDVPDVGLTMFCMLLGDPVPVWYELLTASGEVYAKMPVLKTCKQACCSLCTKRTYQMRAGPAKGVERVNIQIASCPGCCNGEEGSTVWPSKRAHAPSNKLVAQAHLPELHELLSQATSMAEGTELFAPLQAATSIAQAQDKLTDDKIYDLTNRELYKKMSGPTKTCSVKAPAALSAQQKSALLLFAIEKFFFAKDTVERFG